MTKFLTLDKTKKTGKETVFNKVINGGFCIVNASFTPKDYKNILWIGHDLYYGDVFKAWDNNKESFTIYFGEKGDEFDC